MRQNKTSPDKDSLCGIKDSNFHSVRNQILSLARLPIPPMPLAFGKWCLQMSLCDIERTIASALPKTYLTIAFGDPRRDLVRKDTTII